MKEALFPGDELEAVAIVLCGRADGGHDQRLLVHEVLRLPEGAYIERSPVRVVWKTAWLVDHLRKASERGLGLLEIHSHPTGTADFSQADDRADREFFPSIHGWLDDGLVPPVRALRRRLRRPQLWSAEG